jgi:hypothetical protein
MSEHTAEFILVTDAIRRLGPACSRIVPFFLWLSREGSPKVAASSGEHIRLVAVYARRPKVEKTGQDHVLMKVNYSLFEHAAVLQPLRIPVFAAIPCVSRLTDHAAGAPCAWFLLEPRPGAQGDVSIELPAGPSVVELDHACGPLRGPLGTEALVQAIVESGAPMAWPDAFDRIRSAARNSQGVRRYYSPWYARFGSYKPFYLALFDLREQPGELAHSG